MNINLNEKNSNAVLLETQEMFQSQGMSIIGEGYKEIATNPMLFESYIDSLTQGVSAAHVESMKDLMRNSNKQILVETSATGIAPIASLSMPVIRKLWPKFALKEAVKEEVAKSPRFVISYTKPYMFRAKADGTEERIDLPRALHADAHKDARNKTICTRTFAPKADGSYVADFKVAATDPFTGDGLALLTANQTGSAVKIQPLDRDFHVVVTNASGKKYTGELDIAGNVVVDVADSTVLVRVNSAEAVAKVAVIGYDAENIKSIDLVAPLSSEYNEVSWSVGLEIERRDVSIPTGQHINAPLPIEALNDMMALYQIDGTKETTELMTNIVAMNLDKEVLEFLFKSFEEQPGKFYPEFATQFTGNGGAGTTADYAGEFAMTFDVRPAAGYAGGPKAWREELKPQIDFLASKIKNATYLNTGMFVLVANPLDAQLISNIDWQFRGGQGTNVDGVDVDYSVGTYVGAHNYRIISSVNVPAGAMILVFLPAGDKQMTYKYYPYSFSVEHGYIDPNRSRVPSLMMTKRHTFASMLPAIGVINIVNNDGMGQYAPYIQTKAWDAAEWNDTEEYTNANLYPRN